MGFSQMLTVRWGLKCKASLRKCPHERQEVGSRKESEEAGSG